MRKLKLIAIFALMLIQNNPLAFAGGSDVIYGGDPIISAFQEYQLSVIEDLNSVPQDLLPSADFVQQYKAKVAETVVNVSNKPLYKDDSEFMFLNYPTQNPPRIEISRNLWTKRTLFKSEYKKLALHETLHLLGYDDSRYVYSTRITNFVKFFATPLRPYSLIQKAETVTESDDKQAVLWSLINLPKIFSPFTMMLSDEEMASLIKFTARSYFLNQISAADRSVISGNIRNFLNLYTSFGISSTYTTGGLEYECTLTEIERYKDSSPGLNSLLQNFTVRGHIRTGGASAAKDCRLAL